MPDERLYVSYFVSDVRLRVRFNSDRGQILQFLAQLEVLIDSGWTPVVRYDNAHGLPHLDILNRFGHEIGKYWIQAPNNEVLTYGIKDIKHNWERYLARFKGNA